MGKKKEVIRCNVCGVKATKHIAGDLNVCDNPVCEPITVDFIWQTLAWAQVLGLSDNNNKGAVV